MYKSLPTLTTESLDDFKALLKASFVKRGFYGTIMFTIEKVDGTWVQNSFSAMSHDFGRVTASHIRGKTDYYLIATALTDAFVLRYREFIDTYFGCSSLEQFESVVTSELEKIMKDFSSIGHSVGKGAWS